MGNFLSPESLPFADRLMCVELSDGNCSVIRRIATTTRRNARQQRRELLPPNRHGRHEHYSADGFGMHRAYTPDGSIDINVVIHDGDVFCMPRGYHGPCIAAPGYPMYYLNVLAGPGGTRSMAFCDDPTHHWVRDSWADMATDPRCPVTTKEGRTA